MRATLKTRTLLIVGAACLVAACGDSAPTEETGDDAARTAEGEVLGGTISDDMLPLDQVTSQSPPLQGEGTSSASTSGVTPPPSNTDAAPEAGPPEGEPEPDAAAGEG